jgi:hypothetical protein
VAGHTENLQSKPLEDIRFVSADIKHPQNCRFCRWDRRWAGARHTRMRRRETWANVGASGNCAMTDSRVG